ncbi:unannotated protein [freshwater metagenome]|uniref:Unannotated protein n=1 Tax=freshwater metagenome TaxID=449393 RepID=A0A6J7J5A5_9ZZZZ|nr:hypothetical protein [Actinomycetota bacterium]
MATTPSAGEKTFFLNDIPPFTSLGGMPLSPEREEVIMRARDMVPALRERRLETKALRRLPDATAEELRANGLLNLRLPREHGGIEIDNQTYAAVIAELARGCGSTAWTVGIINDVWFLGGTVLPPEGREEFFASGLPGTAPFYPRKVAKGRKVEGGVRIEAGGEWPWASGSQLAGWVMPRVDLFNENDEFVDTLAPLIPMEDCEILDEWHMLAMGGSASNVIRIKDEVFVPDHRVGYMSRVLTNSHITDVPDFMRQPWLTGVIYGLAPISVGLGRAALEIYLERAAGRPIASTTYLDKSAAVRTHLIAAEAAQKIDAADLLLHRGCARLDMWAATGEDVSVADRTKTRADLGYAGKLAQEAVNMLMMDAGASALDDASPLSTIAADSLAMPMHAAFNVTTTLENYGAVLNGHMPPAMALGDHVFV